MRTMVCMVATALMIMTGTTVARAQELPLAERRALAGTL